MAKAGLSSAYLLWHSDLCTSPAGHWRLSPSRRSASLNCTGHASTTHIHKKKHDHRHQRTNTYRLAWGCFNLHRHSSDIPTSPRFADWTRVTCLESVWGAFGPLHLLEYEAPQNRELPWRIWRARKSREMTRANPKSPEKWIGSRFIQIISSSIPNCEGPHLSQRCKLTGCPFFCCKRRICDTAISTSSMLPDTDTKQSSALLPLLRSCRLRDRTLEVHKTYVAVETEWDWYNISRSLGISSLLGSGWAVSPACQSESQHQMSEDLPQVRKHAIRLQCHVRLISTVKTSCVGPVHSCEHFVVMWAQNQIADTLALQPLQPQNFGTSNNNCQQLRAFDAIGQLPRHRDCPREIPPWLSKCSDVQN